MCMLGGFLLAGPPEPVLDLRDVTVGSEVDGWKSLTDIGVDRSIEVDVKVIVTEGKDSGEQRRGDE